MTVVFMKFWIVLVLVGMLLFGCTNEAIRGNPYAIDNQVVERCNKVSNITTRDECFKKEAYTSIAPQYCRFIQDSELTNQCIKKQAGTIYHFGMSKPTEDYCTYASLDFKDECYAAYGLRISSEYCDRIKDVEKKNNCYSSTFV